MRASDRQHYRDDDDAETEKKKKENPGKKPRGDICTVGQFSWER